MLHREHGQIAISLALAHRLDVERGDSVVLTAHRGRTRRQKLYRVTVVMRRMPGFWFVRAEESRAEGSVVMVGRREFGDGQVFDEEAAESIHLLRTDDTELADDLRKDLREGYGLRVRNTRTQIERAQGWMLRSQAILSVVLGLVVILAFFGLVASTYSTILERVREIAILRALGMTRRSILASLCVEGVALMMGAGVLGATVGFGLAWVMVAWVHERLSELPVVFRFPWLLVGSVIAWSIVLGLAGSWLASRRILRRSVAGLLSG